MIAVDTNVLVYAHRRESGHHLAARALLSSLACGSDGWSIPWPCVYEFFGVVTHPRIWKDTASSPEQAWAQIEAWTGSPSISLLGETDGFSNVLRGLVVRPRVRGPVIHDARVAALCIAHGVEVLLTADRDFLLFPELGTRNPFAPA